MREIKLPKQFEPRPFQHDLYKAFFIDGKKRLIQIIHRRAGKTKTALNLLIAAALMRVGVYYHIFPELNQARRNVWNNIDREGRQFLDHIPKSLIYNKHDTDMRITLINGSMIQLAGGDRYDSLRGGNPVGLCFDEYAEMNPNAWYVTSPIIRENGGFAVFCYTPKGYNHGYDLYINNLNNPNYYVSKLDVEQTHDWHGNRLITDEDIEEERRAGMPEQMIQQEYYVSFEAALVGAFYAEQLESAYKDGRVVPFDFDPELPVHTGWDIGIRDLTAIWFVQVIHNEIRFIHYYEDDGRSLEHYINYVNRFLDEHGLMHGMHFAPHDIRVTEFGSGKSREELAFNLGFPFTIAPKLKIMDGIEAVRLTFRRFWFHETQCRSGLNALKQYRADENGKPVHDFASHAADALRYFVIGWQDVYAREKPMETHHYNDLNPFQ